jgi:hypothetical protein
MANFEAIFAGRILILSKNEGYGLQPVHKLSKISWASAPEGQPLCRFVLDLGVPFKLKPVPFKLKPVPFKLKPVPFKLKPVPFKLKPVPFIASNAIGLHIGDAPQQTLANCCTLSFWRMGAVSVTWTGGSGDVMRRMR